MRQRDNVGAASASLMTHGNASRFPSALIMNSLIPSAPDPISNVSEWSILCSSRNRSLVFCSWFLSKLNMRDSFSPNQCQNRASGDFSGMGDMNTCRGSGGRVMEQAVVNISKMVGKGNQRNGYDGNANGLAKKEKADEFPRGESWVIACGDGLFVPERFYRIHTGCFTGREEACEQTNGRQYSGCHQHRGG